MKQSSFSKLLCTLFCSFIVFSCDNPSKNDYTVTWKNYDGTVLEVDKNVKKGSTPTYDGPTPTREKTIQHTYTFSGWTPTIEPVSCDIEYVAQFSHKQNHIIIWKNYDGTTLKTDFVAEGTIPSYTGTTPSKPSTAQYTYSFSGWSPTVVAVTGDTEYTAQFSSSINQYTITWKNWNGSILETDTNVPYGTTPSYDGATPIKPSPAEYSYSFSGWSPTIAAVTGDASYTAQFSCEATGGCTYSLASDGKSYYVSGRKDPSCTDLTVLSVYDGLPVTSIGYSAFSGCSSLASVVFETGSKLTSIGNEAFSNCSSLTSITIPNSVTSINCYAFNGCLSLESITIPNSVTKIGEGAFSRCLSLESITIPNSVTSIDDGTFSGCASLTSITIPSSVTSIGSYVFVGCSSLESIVVESDDTKYDSRANCNAIIETSTNALISGCKNTIIPDSVTSIGISAFSGCPSLPSITIPNSVTSIGSSAFKNCSSLTSIDLSNLNHVITGGKGMFTNCKLSSGSIKVPSNLLEEYKTADYWSSYADYMVGV